MKILIELAGLNPMAKNSYHLLAFHLFCTHLLLSACASNTKIFSDTVGIEPTTTASMKYRSSRSQHDTIVAGEGKITFSSTTCKPLEHPKSTSSKTLKAALLPDSSSENKALLNCSSGMVQSFMKAGLTVHILMWPKRIEDLGGPKDQEFAKKFLIDLGIETNRVEFIWTSGQASISTFFALKNLDYTGTLISENGIYDFEPIITNKSPLEVYQQFEKLSVRNKDEAVESRSISWDPSGLPSRLHIYQGMISPKHLVDSATEFRDSLRTEGFQVKLYLVPDQGLIFNHRIQSALIAEIIQSTRQH